MSFNVQVDNGQGIGYLLQWVNIQQTHQGKKAYLFSLTDVLEQGLINDIFKTIDEISFEDFANVNASKKMDILEKYLDRQFGKRLKWAFKQSLGDFKQQCNIKQLIKLCCYFCIHSKKKNQFINRILTLSQQSQTFLMQQMQKIQSKMQNITQIKQIIQQIQYLQYQNQQLKTKLQEMNKINTQILQLYNQSQNQNKNYKKQIEKYRKQKSQVFAQLKIDYICQYLQAYRSLQQENQRYLEYIVMAENKLENQSKNICTLNNQIKNDYVIMSHLNDQIIRLKQICNQKYDSGDWLSVNSSSNFNVLKSAGSNKENMSKCSTSLGKSMVAPTQWSGVAQNLQDSHFQDKNTIRNHNQQLMTKLQSMYSQYNQLNNQASGLRTLNKKLTKSNTNLRKVMKQFKYKAADNEGKLLIQQAQQIKKKDCQV